MSARTHRLPLMAGGGAAAILLSGCGRQSILSFKSPQTHQITLLWWWMLAAATIVFLGAVVMLTIAWFRRRTPGLPFLGERETLTESLVVLFGSASPWSRWWLCSGSRTYM